MAPKDSIFLTPKQAVTSICTDFRQYGPQILLFCEVLRLMTGDHTSVIKEMKREGAWARLPGRRSSTWMNGRGLCEHLCRTLDTMEPDPKLIAAICARVFQTRAEPGPDPVTGVEGIHIETGIEDFTCRQCGNCCRSLDYHDAVTAEDVHRWETDGREDIIRWVGRFKTPRGNTAYRIWITPGTIEPAGICPFLETLSSENRIICRIHDAKPSICRQYPINRKHALMTGCPGFNRPRP